MTANDFSTATERDALVGFLDQQRDALIHKLDGLSEEDARRAPTVSSLTLLSLLKHSAIWERRWFQIIFAGRTSPDEWPVVDAEAGNDATFVLADDDTVESVGAYYRDRSVPRRRSSPAMTSMLDALGRTWWMRTCDGWRCT